MRGRFSDCKYCGSEHTNLQLVEDNGFKYKAHCVSCGFEFEIPIIYTAEDYARNKSIFKND